MKILSIDSKNNSLKFGLFSDDKLIASGELGRIGIDNGYYKIITGSDNITESVMLDDFSIAIKLLVDKFLILDLIQSIDEIDAIGYKVLFGMDVFNESEIITDLVFEKIKSLVDFAPNYMNSSVNVIEIFKNIFPDKVHVAIFDTAFNLTMEKENYLYSVPYSWFDKYSIRKYGFNGINNKFINSEVSRILKKDNYKLISIYLDDTASVTAIKDGKVINTSMGFGLYSGLITGTNSGDIDNFIIPYIMEKEGKNILEVIDNLNNNSGLLGISELNSDIEEILIHCDENNEKAILAKNMFVRRIVDYIAKYYVLLEGVDVITFSGKIGEKVISIRREIIEKLNILNIKLDLDLNQVTNEIKEITSSNSLVKLFVIPSMEEKIIYEETKKLIRNE